MEVATPCESDPSPWILIDTSPNANQDNPFEVVDAHLIVEGKPESAKEIATEAGGPIGDRIDAETERSVRLELSVLQIQQSLKSLQLKSKLNSIDIKCISAQLCRMLSNSATVTCEITCKDCGMVIASQSDIVSRDFRGQTGPAMLLRRVCNVYDGKSMERMLMTGVHTTAWQFCKRCSTRVGWRYLDAANVDQKYKIGMSCLEAEFVDQD